jgi:hypothetical protein
MFESFRVMCAGIPGGEVLERDGVLITASGLPAAMFNVAFVTRPLPEPRAALEPAVAYFDDRRLPFVLRIRAGYGDPGEEAAKELGLVLGEIAPGMVLDNPRKRLKRPGKLDIREATTEAEREDFAFDAARGFGAPLTMTRALVGFARHGQVDSELYVGYLEGQPVASSTLILSHRVAGV